MSRAKPPSTETPIDKDRLYGVFNRSAERLGRLHELALAKALDLPLLGSMNVLSNQSGAGLIRTALVCIVLLLLGAGAGVGTMALSGGWFRPSQAATMGEQEYTVEFWAEDGTQIEIGQVDR